MSSDPVTPDDDVTTQPEDPNPADLAGDPVGDDEFGTAVDVHTATLEADVDRRQV